MKNQSIFISAGDLSGDNAGALLISELKNINPELNFYGLGGSRMNRLGQKQLEEIENLAVMGFFEVAKRYGFFRRLFDDCVEKIKQERPAVVVLMDYPGFNLRLAEKIKPLGIPVIYYILPQLWAWGEKRVEIIRNNIERMLVILPFEKEFYKKHNIESDFVGHYLLEDINEKMISSEVPSDGHIAVFPGSREVEIKRLLSPMIAAASRFNQMYGTGAVVAGINGAFDYESVLKKYPNSNIEITYDDSRKVIYKSSLVLTKSGTTTLEAAIIGRPMVVAYKTGLITYLIAKNLVRLNNIAMVNLIMNERLVPELIQAEATEERMFLELEKLYNNESHFDLVKGKLDRLPLILGGRGASQRAAKIIGEYLQ